MKTATALPAASPTLSFTVTKDDANARLDKYLGRVATNLSRSFFHALIEQKRVSINGVIAEKPCLMVKNGDLVTVKLPDPQPVTPAPQSCSIPIDLVYEHEHFLIINKPAGIIVHAPHKKSSEPSIVDWLLANYGELKHVGSSDRPGIVHRLDKNTSGLLIIPRTHQAHLYFGAAFKSRTITKIYHALVVGHPPRQGIIDAGITRDPSVRVKMTTTTSLKPSQRVGHIRDAVTEYKVLAYLNGHSLLEVHPRTGRTHQIRVHLASIGFPIIGDPVYGTPSPLIDRHALHAHTLSFSFEGKEYSFSQETPEDFKSCSKKLTF